MVVFARNELLNCSLESKNPGDVGKLFTKFPKFPENVTAYIDFFALKADLHSIRFLSGFLCFFYVFVVSLKSNVFFFVHIFTWGGVEDIRLEAKAENTKKILGQGQGQILSRPRRGMLKAKAKDQAHRSKYSAKIKKGLQKKKI